MPTHTRDDGKPIVFFDTLLEISPFTLFRRLEKGQFPVLVDVRPEPGDRTLTRSVHEPAPDWAPDDSDAEVVVFDDDGTLAVASAQRLQEAGYQRVKALFGGLDLYEFSLDPEILAADTFLVGTS